MSTPEHKEHVWNLIKEIKVGMLVTEDEDGGDLHARPMHLVQDAYDGTLYFFTPKNDAKVYEIQEHRKVCITFTDTKKQVYVSLSGQAKLTQDQQLIDSYWNNWVEAWFAQGRQDPEVAMLVVKIQKGEHWNTNENKLVQLFEMAKANLTESQPEIGENQKFS